MTTFNWHDQAQDEWNQKVSFWNSRSEEMWKNGSRKTVIPFIQKHLKKGALLADVGCGDGFGTSLLAASGYKAIGLDLSEEMVQKASELHKSENLSFAQADIMKLPLSSESVEGVMVINALEWTEHPRLALKELHRVVKRGGYACVGILGPTAQPRTNSYQRLYGEDVICNTMMPWEFEQLAKENGWEVIDGEGVYKRNVTDKLIGQLPQELKQALTFLWLFMLKKQ
ncbi:class I SAM-dependent methyltransferase [Priestia aryabhattai]|jgi:ubiquinone/menaquinone biosynthesis C-methylase UbiE|uniref:class I SAM-dependent methyltransferase n=1 Tax=Priestia TaxID=2800373 RepID=UPI000410CC73|nr:MULTISPECIES: class I SAM-dependent methyltransferase [Priestia]MBK0006389.1 class I SAM-dependent methyltransferase [Bacillus sp. S35]KJL02882.1 methyltransferase [Priestia aryabhattai B8W22]MBX4162786.1 class I SAM-dependent methyltransferase [Priestia megaterium]MBX9966290.1 class I SAM-dependent methyltransferase [Priestia aryabhattai]MBY0028211.1 class I SAM-dependent methyltransferase [Priestia aryabhattai]